MFLFCCGFMCKCILKILTRSGGPKIKPQSMDITCPPGYSSGMLLEVQTPEGMTFEAEIPDGIVPGDVFEAEYYPPDQQEGEEDEEDGEDKESV